MKIYKINDVYFEVIEEELMDNCAAYKLKVNRYLSPSGPNYSFKEEKYFDISIGAKARAEEITEEEFKEAVEHITEKSWTEVYEIEKKSQDGCFILPTLACSARDAYIKTHGISRQDFMSYFHDLREKLNGR